MVDTARCALTNIPEAIQHPRELALGRSWSVLSGSHLTFTASEDILANGHGGSTNQMRDAMTAKDQLRIDLRKIRQTFVKKHNNQDMFDVMTHHLDALIDDATIIASYLKFGSEVDANAILERAHHKAIATALPHVAARNAPMTFKRWQPGNALSMAAFGFQQPLDDAPDIIPDLIIVPLVGFDRMINRLGQGAGHYDRAFPKYPSALRIGLAWSCQELATVPTDSWDVPLDAVLTEKEWIVGTQSRIGT